MVDGVGASPRSPPLRTPDGRYIVVRGRLWRATNPNLSEEARVRWVRSLMQARAAVRRALAADDAEALRDARARVQAAKVALGERGQPWWDGGEPDLGGHMAMHTRYAEWYRRRR